MRIALSISNSFTYVYTNYYELISKLGGDVADDEYVDRSELVRELLEDILQYKFKVYITKNSDDVSILIHYQYPESKIVTSPEEVIELYNDFRDMVTFQVEELEKYFTVKDFRIYNIIMYGEFLKKGDLNLVKAKEKLLKRFKQHIYYIGKPLGGGLEFAGLVANFISPQTRNKVSMSMYTTKSFTATHINDEDVPFWWSILKTINDEVIGDLTPITSKDIKLFKG